MPSFVVEEGLRYRFRVAHAGGSGCPIYFRIEDHPLIIIALDSSHIEPIKTNAFRITQGNYLF